MVKLLRSITVVVTGLLVFQFSSSAQLTNAKGWYDDVSKIEDIKIGWIDILKFKSPAPPFAKDGWGYSSKEVEASQKLTSWIQQTYTPTGLLGEMKQSFLALKERFGPGSKDFGANDAEKYNYKALPNTYGFYAKLHQCLVKTSTREFWPMPGNHCDHDWYAMVNNVELISKQQIYLSDADAYFCTQPRYRIGMKGEFDKDWRVKNANYRDFTSSPNLKPYDHYLLPAKAVSASGDGYVVILSRDNKPLPFEQVTMGMLIARLESRLSAMTQIYYNNGGTTPQISEKMKAGIAVLKTQFRNNMDDFVYYKGTFTQIDPLDVAGFEPGKKITMLMVKPEERNEYGETTVGIPLLKMKQGTRELCATGPQWIVFRIDGPISSDYGGSIHMMDHFVSRYNYNYVYRYFFGNEKLTEPYRALDWISADEKNKMKGPATLSAAMKTATSDPNNLFFDDFSGTATGGIPADWFTVKNTAEGNKPTVVEVSGAKGKWLRLQRHAYPTLFTKSLTGDFKLSFDLLVRKGDVPWGTPGMQLQLFTEGKPNNGSSESSVSAKYRFAVDVSPGDMNRTDAQGWVMIERVMPPGFFQCKTSNYYSVPFTGSKLVNTTTITIQRKGTSVTVFCNAAKVYECDNAFPAEMAFSHLRFYVNEKNVYHISNINISKK